MRSRFLQLRPFLRGFLAVAVSAIGIQPQSVAAQTKLERFWLAGRYDWNRIVVYFDAVQFSGTIPPEAEKIPCPIQIGFFCPVELPGSYVAQLQKAPGSEQFAVGDKYDLILDSGSIVTVTLTTLVGFESDEGVGNDSFIGALATVDKDKGSWLYFMSGYRVVRRHQDVSAVDKTRTKYRTVVADLSDEPVEFDVQTKIVDLLRQRLRSVATPTQAHLADSVSPLFAVQQFRLSDGSIRYYARAGWKSGKRQHQKLIYGLSAWIAPQPTPHILAIDSKAGFEYLPELLNVIEIGSEKIGIIVSEHHEDGGAIKLLEYQDGTDLGHMRVLQSLGADE